MGLRKFFWPSFVSHDVLQNAYEDYNLSSIHATTALTHKWMHARMAESLRMT